MSKYIPKYKIDWSKEKRLKEKPGYMGEFTFDLIQQLYIKCDEKDKKIERLNAILTELEEWVENDTLDFETTFYMGRAVNYKFILDKIQELKEKYK